MFVLTVSARDIRNSMLPNVTARRLTQEEFEFTYTVEGYEEEFAATKRALAIPKELYDRGEIFILTVVVVNGERRDAVRQVFPQIGAENEDFYEVTSGIDRSDFVVFDSSKKLENGAEVFVIV
jgi:hypothetical protein